MEYYIPQNEKTFTKKPLRRKRLKVKPVNPSQLSREDLADLGMLNHEGEVIGKSVNEEKYQALIQEGRYRNAVRVKGYKFTGAIPEPKNPSDYLPKDSW